MRHRTGHYLWVMDSGRVFRDGSGTIVRQAGAVIDISARKESEEELRRQANLIDLSFEPIFAWHPTRGIVEWNKGAEQVYGYTREEALGRNSHQLLRTLHPLPLPELQKMEFDHGQWSGELEHTAKDGRKLTVESRHQLIDANGEVLVLETNRDITERKKAEAFTARMAAVALASHDALYGATPQGMIEAWNPGAERLFGYAAAEAIGQHISMLAQPNKHMEQQAMLADVASGKTVGPLDTMRIRKDGTIVEVSLAVAPVKAPNGTVVAISAAVHDISDRKEWEKRQRLMTRELAHRGKNSFAILQAILRSTLKASPDPNEFASAFSGRLHSMAAAQDILTESNWKGAELGALAMHQLSNYVVKGSAQFVISGSPINLHAEHAAPFALILNELATNALKYGALSVPTGKIDLSWRTEITGVGKTKLIFSWCEQGGPRISTVGPRSFGTTLIERSLPDARVELTLHPDGLICVIELELVDPQSV